PGADDLAAAAGQGCTLALGSVSDVRKLRGRAAGARVLLRVNPGVGEGHHRHVVTGGSHSKFGIAPDDLDEASAACRDASLDLAGLHAHMGSGILDPAPFLAAADALLLAAQRLPRVGVLDFGGGFGVPYREEERELPVEELGAALRERLGTFARG